MHAVDKQISRQGDLEFDTNALLRRTAQLTVGYSGAELANLLNEAAIIAVRREKPEIGMPELELAMEKMKLGLPRPPLTRSEEKRKLAYIEAGRAVLITRLAPALPDVLQVRGNDIRFPTAHITDTGYLRTQTGLFPNTARRTPVLCCASGGATASLCVNRGTAFVPGLA